MFERRSGIFIPYNYKNIQEIKEALTRNVLQWSGEVKEIKFYEEDKRGILIPRYFPLNEKIIDKTSEGKDIEIESKTKPISERQKKYIEEFKKRNYGIIRLEPGSGKTYIATQLVCYYKKKTIVICHKDKLLDQWKEEFLKHTTIKETEIDRLTSKNFKECLNKSIILTTPHVIFRSIIEKKELIEELEKSNIGILFVDECHVGIGPEQFSKSSIYINARRTFGLSATPFRSDGLNDIIEMHLGEVVYIEPNQTDLVIPDIYVVIEDFDVYKKNKYMHFNGKFQVSRYFNQLYKSEKLKEIFKKIIKKLVEKKRKILCLANNVKLLYTLAYEIKEFKEMIGIFSPRFYEKYSKKDILQVTDTFDLVEAFYNKSIVFSTYNYCRDGNNRIDLDTLLMITPTNNPEQAIGRILRNMENKPTPIVIDFVDKGGPKVYSNKLKKETTYFLLQFYKRQEIYSKIKKDKKIKVLTV